jgi:hypothetical protein
LYSIEILYIKPDIFEVEKLKINEILNSILYSIEILYIKPDIFEVEKLKINEI